MKRSGPWIRIVIDGLSILVLSSFAVAVIISRLRPGSEPGSRSDGRPAIAFAEFAEVSSTANWIGPKPAPVVVLVYSDYLCGFCAELHETLQELGRRYPQHVALAIKHFVKSTSQEWYQVALGAECAAEQDPFSAYDSAAFRNGRMLRYSNAAVALADSAAVPDRAQFVKCMSARKYLDRLVTQYDEGRRLGVLYTPTVFVNGDVVVGAAPIAVLDSMVARHLRHPPEVQ